jgi:hypothetical protein
MGLGRRPSACGLPTGRAAAGRSGAVGRGAVGRSGGRRTDGSGDEGIFDQRLARRGHSPGRARDLSILGAPPGIRRRRVERVDGPVRVLQQQSLGAAARRLVHTPLQNGRDSPPDRPKHDPPSALRTPPVSSISGRRCRSRRPSASQSPKDPTCEYALFITTLDSPWSLTSSGELGLHFPGARRAACRGLSRTAQQGPQARQSWHWTRARRPPRALPAARGGRRGLAPAA